MTSQHRIRAGVVAALSMASLIAAAPAGADPNPTQRVQSSGHAAAGQEQYNMTHKPSIPGPGHDFGTIDPPATTAPASSSGFAWDDAAIGAGSTVGLVLLLAGGAAAIGRRHRPVTS